MYDKSIYFKKFLNRKGHRVHCKYWLLNPTIYMYVYCVHADLEHDKFVFASIGMTWIQEIVYLVQTLDFEGSGSIDCDERIPYLEFPTSTLTDLSEKPSPRIIKTHLPLKLLPTQIQTIQPKVRGFEQYVNWQSNSYDETLPKQHAFRKSFFFGVFVLHVYASRTTWT